MQGISNPNVAKVLAFFNEIGLPWKFDDAAAGFLPDVDIKDGVMQVSSRASVSSLLHEAGHLAVMTGDARPYCQSNVNSAVKVMFEHYQDLDPDHPALRAAYQSSDPEATAWAWAAGRHLDLPGHLVICDEDYEGDGRDIRSALSLNSYLGINGLRAAGMCEMRGPDAYPKLTKWLQDDFGIIPKELIVSNKISRARIL